MAGTLTISTLSDGTNSTSSTNCIQGSAKAWVNYTGAAGAVQASYNVSSVTRNGTGDYTINFTNALTDANYAIAGGLLGTTVSGGSFQIAGASATGTPTTKTTTQVRVYSANNSGVFDSGNISAIILR